MRILEFEAKGQKLSKKPGCDFSHIIMGSVGYLKAKFYFSEEDWADCRKVASFYVGDVDYAVLLDADDSCIIPADAVKREVFEVMVTGAKNIPHLYRIETNKYKVKQEVN